MNSIMKEIGVIAAAIIGLAIIAVLVSNRANTANVIKAAGQAFGGAIGAATNPFSGANAYGSFGSGLSAN